MLLENRTLGVRNGSTWPTLLVCALALGAIGNGSALTSLDSFKATEHPSFQEGQQLLKLKEVIHVYKEPPTHSQNINGETTTQNRTRRSEPILKQEDFQQEKKLKDMIRELDSLEDINKATTEHPSLTRFRKSRGRGATSETQNKTLNEVNQLLELNKDDTNSAEIGSNQSNSTKITQDIKTETLNLTNNQSNVTKDPAKYTILKEMSEKLDGPYLRSIIGSLLNKMENIEKEQNMIKLVLQENSLPSNSTQLRKGSKTETDIILRKFRTLSGQVKNIGEHQIEIIDRISSKHLPLISSEGAEC